MGLYETVGSCYVQAVLAQDRRTGGVMKVELTKPQIFALLYALDLWLDVEAGNSRLANTGRKVQEKLREVYRR